MARAGKLETCALQMGLNHLLCINGHLKSETLIPQTKVAQKYSNKVTSKRSKLTVRDSP